MKFYKPCELYEKELWPLQMAASRRVHCQHACYHLCWLTCKSFWDLSQKFLGFSKYLLDNIPFTRSVNWIISRKQAILGTGMTISGPGIQRDLRNGGAMCPLEKNQGTRSCSDLSSTNKDTRTYQKIRKTVDVLPFKGAFEMLIYSTLKHA